MTPPIPMDMDVGVVKEERTVQEAVATPPEEARVLVVVQMMQRKTTTMRQPASPTGKPAGAVPP